MSRSQALIQAELDRCHALKAQLLQMQQQTNRLYAATEIFLPPKPEVKNDVPF